MASEPANYLNKFLFVDMKQQNRFILEIDDIPAYFVRVSGLPNIDNNPVVVDTINSEYKIKGKSRWQNISITLYDPIAGEDGQGTNGADKVWTWLNEYHHRSNADKDGFMDDYKRDLTLFYITPTGEKADEWKLHGAFCASINWGDVDVSSDDLINIEIDLSYDWAEYKYKPGAGAGIGATRKIPGPDAGQGGGGGAS
jgi:hypothetical protein